MPSVVLGYYHASTSTLVHLLELEWLASGTSVKVSISNNNKYVYTLYG